MKNSFLKKYTFLFCLFISFLTYSKDDVDCYKTVITSPEYQGKFYGDFTWLYLKSMPTDADLETGTLITLTAIPANLSACLQQLQSKRSHAFRVNLGYNIPSTSYNVDFNFFHYKGSDGAQVGNIRINQLFQSFLGGAYSTLQSCEGQKINFANLLFAKRYLIDCHLLLHPYIGIGYGNVKRTLEVEFTGLIDSPPSVINSTLNGCLESKYWGVGPVFGSHFSYPLVDYLSLQGTIGGGVLFGRITSCLSAVERNKTTQTIEVTPFNGAECNTRTMPFINTQLSFAFHPMLNYPDIDGEVTIGYELDYYFNVIDRINPFNGFVENDNSFPVKQSSHLGLGGPFIKLSINSDNNYFNYNEVCDSCECGYFYGAFASWWLKPVPNNDDLVFATIGTSDGCQINQQVCLDRSWSGIYTLGYQMSDGLDFHGSYLRFKDESSTKICAQGDARISSVNASGSSAVTYSAAQSCVNYNLNQVEFIASKCFFPFCNFQMYLATGIRYAALKRRLQNQYTGGIPPQNFESKFNCLTSTFRGAGPAFSINPSYYLWEGLQISAYLSTSLLRGNMRSTLDQQNVGTLDKSSNTLRTPVTRWITPVVDARLGLSFQSCILSEVYLKVQTGYQFSEYFKGINLVLPNFLTGLQQLNSDLKLHGPYLSIKLGF